jgi:endo-1,4-beta-mannosidase
MATINIYDFSDKLNADKSLREEFLDKYVSHLVNNMDANDIIADWSRMVYENLYTECKQDGADGLVEQVAHEYPDLLQDEFGVDTSLVA